VGAHLSAHSVQLRNNSPELALLRKSLTDKSRTTIISTVPHNILKLTEQVTGQDLTPIAEIFDVVVLDESSQIDLVMALRPLTLLRPTGQLIIAGDQLQMPPIQGLDPPVGAEYLVGSIQTYLLHRFKIPTQDLLVNYRSNRDLVDFAKTLGYPRKLEAADPERQLHSLAPISQVVSSLPPHLPKSECYEELLVPERRVTALIHDDVVSSQANEFEARIVAGIAYCIRHVMSQEASTDFLGHFPFTDESFFKDGVGIVTPHKAQKALVVQELRTLFPDVDPKLVFEAVDTVERFQGGQRQTIIVSFGIGDVDVIQGEEEFLLQMERTNVAVSRAKSKCIVLMPKSLAYHLPTDQKAAQTAVAIKSYIEEFCANRKVVTLADGATSRGAEVRWH
jgi:superfamily I DNA and/or RNA helicase